MQQPPGVLRRVPMYVEDWDSFLQMSEALFRQAPLRTRYVLKYRHCDGKLVLKVTDDIAVSDDSIGFVEGNKCIRATDSC